MTRSPPPISIVNPAIPLVHQIIPMQEPLDVQQFVLASHFISSLLARSQEPLSLEEALTIMRGFLVSQPVYTHRSSLVATFSSKGPHDHDDYPKMVHLRAQERDQDFGNLGAHCFYTQGTDLLTRFRSSRDNTLLDDAILRLRVALCMMDSDHPTRCQVLGHLARALADRFYQTGHDIDLEEGTALREEVLRILPATHPDRCGYLNDFANLLSMRSMQKRQVDDLEEAI